MNRKDIVTLPAHVLREKAKHVIQVDDSIQKLAEGMVAATLDWEDSRKHEVGVALAANQVGNLNRVIIVRKDYRNKQNKEFLAYINPAIIKAEGEMVERQEGCLSVKDVYGTVLRYPRVKIRAQTLRGKTVRFSASGFLARIFQHEIDHLDGKLFIDRVKDNQFYRLDPNGELVPLEKKQLKHVKED